MKLSRAFLRIDWWLATPALLLSTLGILILRSVAPQIYGQQLLFLAVAVGIFLLFSVTDYQALFHFHLLSYLASIIFLITPFIFSSHSRGAVRWLQFGEIFVQPSELVKPFLLIAFVSFLSYPQKKYWWFFVSFLIPSVLIFIQPDLGSTLVLGAGWLTLLLFQGLPWWLFVLPAVFTPAFWFLLREYQKERILTFINPYADPLGRGYHVIQSIIAVGSGQFLGRGLGHGTQSQLRFLPERHTDFIFASLSEELGFIGSSLTIIIFALLLWRIWRISQTSSDPKASLFCQAMLGLLLFQIFVNIGMNMGIAPITGITLPFLSYGGSSLVSMAIGLGIINSISKAGVTHSSLQIR